MTLTTSLLGSCRYSNILPLISEIRCPLHVRWDALHFLRIFASSRSCTFRVDTSVSLRNTHNVLRNHHPWVTTQVAKTRFRSLWLWDNPFVVQLGFVWGASTPAAPRNDVKGAVIASGAKQSTHKAYAALVMVYPHTKHAQHSPWFIFDDPRGCFVAWDSSRWRIWLYRLLRDHLPFQLVLERWESWWRVPKKAIRNIEWTFKMRFYNIQHNVERFFARQHTLTLHLTIWPK